MIGAVSRDAFPGRSPSSIFAQGILDQRPDAFEKVLPHRRFVAREAECRLARFVVRDERSASSSRRIAEPDKVLFHG